MSDAIDVLVNDHRTVEQMFTQLESGSVDQAVLDDVIRELSIHAAIEEQVLYPALRKELGDGNELADHSIEEHQQVKNVLSDLEKQGADGPETPALVAELIATVRDHVEDEETRMFPELRQAVSADALRTMGEALQKAKKMAPTHPHPLAPNEPPGNIVAGPAAAVADRVRDALRG